MKGIMFNETYGLETAVLNGNKTRTWRADKKPRYKIGEIVAIKQCYKQVTLNSKEHCEKLGLINEFGFTRTDILISEGYTNKMFVKNELMPHHIKITGVKQCRLQDITDEECLREGIDTFIQGETTYYNVQGIYVRKHSGALKPFKTAKYAFFMLITKLCGWGCWFSNPEGYAYEFKIIK